MLRDGDRAFDDAWSLIETGTRVRCGWEIKGLEVNSRGLNRGREQRGAIRVQKARYHRQPSR